jgi:hypothetical protein
VELFEEVRREYTHGTGTIQGVSRKLGVHRRMVRQALSCATPPKRKQAVRSRPSLGPVMDFIDEILSADERAPKKQRHTARRIWNRIQVCTKGLTCGLTSPFKGANGVFQNRSYRRRISELNECVALISPIESQSLPDLNSRDVHRVEQFLLYLPYRVDQSVSTDATNPDHPKASSLFAREGCMILISPRSPLILSSTEANAMHRTKVSVSFGPLFLSIFLVASIVSTPLRAEAQAQAADAAVAVRLMDPVDSSKDPAGKQYHALVTRAVDAGNGVMIPQGAAAMVTLENSGSGWTTQLASVTVNGQPVAVASGPASVTSAAQSAASAAVNSVGSMLGGFGHHVSAPKGVAAVAMGQRVVLPPGTMLNFVLSQPAASRATPAAPAVAVAPSIPQPTQSSSAPVTSAGQHWWLCQYQDKKDPGKPALGSLMYYAVLPSSDSFLNDHGKHFNAYVQQNYKIMDPNSADKGFCRRTSDDDAARATSMEMFQKQWRSSNIEPIQVNFANTPAKDAAIDAKLARGAQQRAAPVVNSKECAYHATCGTASAPKPD